MAALPVVRVAISASSAALGKGTRSLKKKRSSSSSTASVISPKRSGVISAGSRRLATDIALLCQILEVLPDEVLLVLRDQLPVDLALGGRAVLGEHLAVGHQAGGLAAIGI